MSISIEVEQMDKRQVGIEFTERELPIPGYTLYYGTENYIDKDKLKEIDDKSRDIYTQSGFNQIGITREEWTSNFQMYNSSEILNVFIENKNKNVVSGIKTFFNKRNKRTLMEDFKSHNPLIEMHEIYEDIDYDEIDVSEIPCSSVGECSRLFSDTASIIKDTMISTREKQLISFFLIYEGIQIGQSLGLETIVGVIERDKALRLLKRIERMDSKLGQSSIHTFERWVPILNKIPQNAWPYFEKNKGVPFLLEVDKYVKSMQSKVNLLNI